MNNATNDSVVSPAMNSLGESFASGLSPFSVKPIVWHGLSCRYSAACTVSGVVPDLEAKHQRALVELRRILRDELGREVAAHFDRRAVMLDPIRHALHRAISRAMRHEIDAIDLVGELLAISEGVRQLRHRMLERLDDAVERDLKAIVGSP